MIPTTDELTHPLAAGFDVRINNTYWQSAPNGEVPSIVRPEDRERSPVVAPENPEDVAVREEEVSWSRSGWAGGEGLAVAHRRDGQDDDYVRYWSSRRLLIEPANTHSSGRVETLTLLHSMGLLEAYPSGPTDIMLTAYDNSLFVAIDTSSDVTLHTSPTGSTTEQPGPSAEPVTALTRIGRQVYVSAGADGIRERTEAGTWQAFNAGFQASQLWGVKRLLLGAGVGADENKLYLITSGAATVVMTLPVGERFVDLADGGSHILAAASDGYVYALSEDAGSVTLAGESLIEGEEITTLAVSQGVVIVGTSQPTGGAGGALGRLWRADVGDGGLLANKQLLRVWGQAEQAEDCTPRSAIGAQGDAYVWVCNRVWRLHLETGGLVSYLEAAEGTATGLSFLAGKMVLGLIPTSGTPQTYIEADDYETDGYLISPAIDFFTERAKQWASLGLFHGSLASGESVRLYYSTDPSAIEDPDAATWILATARVGVTGAVDEDIPLTGVRSRWLALKVQLGGNGLTTPSVRSLSARAREVAGDWQVQVNLNVSDWVDSPWRRRRRVAGLGLERWRTLLGFADSDVEIELIAQGFVIRGPVRIINPPLNARASRGSSSVEAQIVVEGSTISTVAGTDDSYAMGIQPMGIPILGGVAS